LLSSDQYATSVFRYQLEKGKIIMAPPKKDTVGVMLRLPAAMLKKIDDIRRQQDDIPTRPEMIRRILAMHLEAKGSVN
jgi:hypothetical protein